MKTALAGGIALAFAAAAGSPAAAQVTGADTYTAIGPNIGAGANTAIGTNTGVSANSAVGTNIGAGVTASVGTNLAAGGNTANPSAGTDIVVGGRPVAGYDGPGISSGDFVLFSGVTLGTLYDSNIFRTQSGVVRDYMFFVAPTFDLTHVGADHTEEFIASALGAAHAVSSADDFTNVLLNVRESYLLSPNSQLFVNASYADVAQPRVSNNHDIPTNAAGPVQTQALSGSLGFTQFWTYFTTGATFTATHQTFDDVRSLSGSLLDQTFRNGDDYALAAFLNIPLSQHIQNNLTISVDHGDARDQTRDVNEWSVADSLIVNLTSKTSIGFSVSLGEQDFFNTDDIIRPLLGYEVSLGWQPAQRLQFTLRAGYHDLAVDFTRGYAGGGFGQYGSLGVTYLIWRNLALTSNTRYEEAFLSGVSGVQSTITQSTALNYELSSHAGLSFIYSLDKLTSGSPQYTPFNENVFQLSLNLRL